MSRQLKFRAYDNINKEWLLGYKECGGFSINGLLILMGEWQAILSKMLKGEFGEDGKELFVQQYTGLKDKNEVEIYEGDIIRFENKEGVWSYQVGRNIEVKFPFICGNADLGEVIGNIFETPELLKI